MEILANKTYELNQIRNKLINDINDTSNNLTQHDRDVAQKELMLVEDKIKEETDKNKRVLHIIPHSHTDEGWLSTVEEFFTGDDYWSIYIGSVKEILDSTIEELILGKNRTFTFAETKYFKQWYDMQEDIVKKKVREMVKEGRLDLVSGGWSAPDEATT